MSSPPKVLLIDEVHSNRWVVRSAVNIRFPGVGIVEAQGEDELRTHLLEMAPDLIILHYDLSWISGVQLAPILRMRWPKCPMVIYTATVEASAKRTVRLQGLTDCEVCSYADMNAFLTAICDRLSRMGCGESAILNPAVVGCLLPEVQTAFWKSALEGCSEGVLAMELPSGRPVYVNPALARLFGFAREEILGLTLADLHPKDQLKWIEELLADPAVVPGEMPREFRCLCKAGEAFADVRFQRESVQGHEFALLFYQDATDRRLQERRLRELAGSLPGAVPSEDFWRQLADSGSAAFDEETFFAAELVDRDLGSFRVLGSAGDARFPSAGELPVEDEPWTDLLRRRFVGHAQAVRKDYARSKSLERCQAEAFLGLPLSNDRGEVIGVVGVISRHPLRKIKFAKAILQIHAALAVQRLRLQGVLADKRGGHRGEASLPA